MDELSLTAGEPAREALALSRSGLPLAEIAARLGVSVEAARELIEDGSQTEARVGQVEGEA